VFGGKAAWNTNASSVATMWSPPTRWPCNSASNVDAAPVRGYAYSSAATSMVTTRSGTAPAALGASAPAAIPSEPADAAYHRAAISRCQTVAAKSRISNRGR
jgi:hypothetical protein